MEGNEPAEWGLRTAPERLWGHSTLKVEWCAADGRLPGEVAKPCCLLLGTEGVVHEGALGILGLIRKAFRLGDAGPWRWQVVFYHSLLRQFFSESSDSPAWISVVPRRIPYESRFSPLTDRSEEAVWPKVIASELRVNRLRLDLGFQLGVIDTESLLLGYERRSKADRPYLVRQVRTRQVRSGQLHESTDLLFYLAHPAVDEELVKGARVPAMQRYFHSQDRILTTAAIMLAKMDSSPPWDVTQLSITLQPEDGWTAALASGRRTLHAYLLQYPLEHQLLLQAIAQ